MNSEKIIYNEMSIRQILNNMPKGILKSHRNEYISNCIEIHRLPGNATLGQHLRFRNIVIIQYYNSPRFVFQQPKISRSHGNAIERAENFNTIDN